MLADFSADGHIPEGSGQQNVPTGSRNSARMPPSRRKSSMSPECWRHGEKEAGCEAERNARSWGSRRSRPGGAAEAFDPIHFVRKVLAPPPRRGAGAERDPGVPRLRHPPPSFRPSGTLRNLRTTDNGQRTTDNGQRTTDKRKSKNPLTPGRISAYISSLMRKSVTEQSPHIQETTTPPLHLSNLRQGYHRQANLQLIVLRDTP